jgi:hypothetical protein
MFTQAAAPLLNHFQFSSLSSFDLILQCVTPVVETAKLQGSGKIIEALQILYIFIYYGVGPLFTFIRAAVRLGMDSYKF